MCKTSATQTQSHQALKIKNTMCKTCATQTQSCQILKIKCSVKAQRTLNLIKSLFNHPIKKAWTKCFTFWPRAPRDWVPPISLRKEVPAEHAWVLPWTISKHTVIAHLLLQNFLIKLTQSSPLDMKLQMTTNRARMGISIMLLGHHLTKQKNWSVWPWS